MLARGSVVVVAAALAVVATSAVPAQPRVPGFKTPSGNIVCVFTAGTIRCDIGTWVRPLPPRPKDCDVDWGQGVELGRAGRASIVCAGDTNMFVEVRTLAYGRTWRRGAITCVSRSVGLTCRNRSGRGFFLSRERTRLF
jgi:hypothetical protein